MKTVLALGLLSLLPSQPAKYDLIWKPKVGQKLVYSVNLTGTLAEQPFGFSSDIHITVRKVEPKGGYTLGTVYKNTVAKLFGETEKIPEDPEEVTRYDAHGESLDPEDPTGESDAIAEIISRAGEMEPPKKPVAVGESWTHEFPADKKLGLPTARATYKLVSLANGKLTVSFQYAESSGSAPTKIKGTEILRASDGASLSVDSQIQNARVVEGVPATNLKLVLRLK